MKIEDLKTEMKKYRKKYGMNQGEFAKFAGMLPVDIEKIESGKQTPDRNQLMGICKALELDQETTNKLLLQTTFEDSKPEQSEKKVVVIEKTRKWKKDKIKQLLPKYFRGEISLEESCELAECKRATFYKAISESGNSTRKVSLIKATPEEQKNNIELLEVLTLNSFDIKNKAPKEMTVEMFHKMSKSAQTKYLNTI